MKRLFAKLFAVVALVIALLVPASAKAFTREESKMIMEMAMTNLNSTLPTNVAGGMVLYHAEFDSDSNTLIEEIRVDNAALFASVDVSRESIDDRFMPMVKTYYDLGVLENYIFGLQLNYHGPDGAVKTINITPKDVARMKTKIEAGDKMVTFTEMLTKEIGNMQLPMKITEGMTCTSVSIDGNQVIYVYETSPLIYNAVASNQDVQSSIRDNLITNFRKSYQLYAKQMVDENIAMYFVYMPDNDDNAKPITIKITCADLYPDMMPGK